MSKLHKSKKNLSKNYRKVNVPESMAILIDEIVNDNKELGFRGVDDFVRDAVRDSIIKYNQIINGKNLNKGVEVNVP